jgi:hypothetical protein
MDRIEKLVALAHRHKTKGWYDPARDAMKTAQKLWQNIPRLSTAIPMPDFTAAEWLELDVLQTQGLVAVHAMIAAPNLRPDIPPLSTALPRSEFTTAERHKLDVLQMEALVALARRNKSNGNYNSARNAMRAAQKLWHEKPPLSTALPRPDFTTAEWHEVNVQQIEALVDLAHRNAQSGWRGGAQNAISQAQELLAVIEDNARPARPSLQLSGYSFTHDAAPRWTLTQDMRVDFECPICYSSKIEGVEHTTCKNIFCLDCLTTWSDISAACPLCRKDL